MLCAADLWTLKGHALLALNTDYNAVEECYQNALALARRLGARVSTLRAVTRLAQFQLDRGHAESGFLALQEIYAGFSEGHDTPDLRFARKLLEQQI